MPLNCPRCGEEIRAGNVDLTARLAKCWVCNEVFGFDVPGTPAGAANGPAPARVPRPECLRVTDDGYTRRIVRRWFHPGLLFMVLFCVAWDSFLVAWYWMALAGPPANAPAPVDWLVIVFPVCHVAAGVGMTYATLAGLLNRTAVTVAGGRLVVAHGPVPCGGNRNLDAADVASLYCEEDAPAGGWSPRNRQRPTRSFRLMAATTDGRAVTLLRRIEAKAEALFYEQQLEEWLGIGHRPVPGAVQR